MTGNTSLDRPKDAHRSQDKACENGSVDFTEAVGRAVIDNAYDPEYGARPLKRYIQRYLETAIARAIVGDGIDATKPIKIDYRDGFAVTN